MPFEQFAVFRDPAAHALAPKSKAGGLQMIGIRFCPVSVARARVIVAGRAKGRIAFEGLEHGADFLSLTVSCAKN